jgi:hypothetical protein
VISGTPTRSDGVTTALARDAGEVRGAGGRECNRADRRVVELRDGLVDLVEIVDQPRSSDGSSLVMRALIIATPGGSMSQNSARPWCWPAASHADQPVGSVLTVIALSVVLARFRCKVRI